MKINRKYYPVVYVLCIIMIIVFSAIHAYNPKREGFNVNISGLNTNNITRKIGNFKSKSSAKPKAPTNKINQTNFAILLV